MLGYEISGQAGYLREAVARARYLRTGRLEQPVRAYSDQASLGEALEQVSRLPGGEGGFFPAIWKLSNGMRVFGWTHSYNIPWLIHAMQQEGLPADE